MDKEAEKTKTDAVIQAEATVRSSIITARAVTIGAILTAISGITIAIIGLINTLPKPEQNSPLSPIFVPTSTPYRCPYKSQTDHETIIKLIEAEAAAVNTKDAGIILAIFAPDAVFHDHASAPSKEWNSPIKRYQDDLFKTMEFQSVDHFDISLAEIIGNTAYYTSGSKGYYRVGNGDWVEMLNGSLTSTQYGSEHWVLQKNTNGCWVIVQMDFNAGHIKFPP